MAARFQIDSFAAGVSSCKIGTSGHGTGGSSVAGWPIGLDMAMAGRRHVLFLPAALMALYAGTAAAQPQPGGGMRPPMGGGMPGGGMGDGMRPPPPGGPRGMPGGDSFQNGDGMRPPMGGRHPGGPPPPGGPQGMRGGMQSGDSFQGGGLRPPPGGPGSMPMPERLPLPGAAQFGPQGGMGTSGSSSWPPPPMGGGGFHPQTGGFGTQGGGFGGNQSGNTSQFGR